MKSKWGLSVFVAVLGFNLGAVSPTEVLTDRQGGAVIDAGANAAEIMSACRAMLPKEAILVTGNMVTRDRKGRALAEYDFELKLDKKASSKTEVKVFKPGTREVVAETGNAGEQKKQIAETDVTWRDLSFAYLYWPEVCFDEKREAESVHGQKCQVLIVAESKAATADKMRIWVDRKTGCMMQAEELGGEGEATRRIWGTRIKKFGSRWMANVLEIETSGSGHRTKIVIDTITEI